VIGATLVGTGSGAIHWHNLLRSVVAPAVLSPIVAGFVALIGTYLAYRLIRHLGDHEARTGYRFGQIGSASLVSLAHGTNDAQKTMGIISLALIAHGDISAAHFMVPLWVKLACATSLALGTATGGWRIINTMGNRITDVESPQGFAAESASAAVILASSYYGYPLSTTQVVSGGVTGSGLGRRLGSVHWEVLGQMASAWLLTIPGAGLLGATAYEISSRFGAHDTAGSLVIATLAGIAAFVLFRLAQRNNVRPEDLDRTNLGRTHLLPEAEEETVAEVCAEMAA
jgi:PiT family inorganic phosphate transporter